MIEQIRYYDRQINPKYIDTDDFQMISSGSDGNSLILKRYGIIIDLGCTYGAYPDDTFYNTTHILLTHHHSDHINFATLRTVLTMHPYIKIVMSQDMRDRIEGIDEKAHRMLNITNTIILSKDAPVVVDIEDDILIIDHNVTDHEDIPNVAYILTSTMPCAGYDTPVILYASDLFTVEQTAYAEGLPKEHLFNIMFLEANHDRALVEEALERDPFDIKAKGNQRHLSEKEAFDYVYESLHTDGIFIPLHASSTYGTFKQR